MKAVLNEDAPSTRPEAFDRFVMARGRSLWMFAWHLSHDRQRAEDLVQTALLKSYSKFDRVSATGSFDAYVRRVIFTTFLASKPAHREVELLADLGSEADRTALVDSRRDLMSAMSALPAGQRAVLALRYIEDLSEAQTAEILGCSIGNVKSQTSRALAFLRRSGLLTVED